MGTVSEEVATSDFGRMLEAADIDVEGMSKEEHDDFSSIRRKMIRLIERGKLIVNENGLPTLKTCTEAVPELHFKNMMTEIIIAQGRVLNGNEAAKARATLAESTGVPAKLISTGVKGKDFLRAQQIMNLFLVD